MKALMKIFLGNCVFAGNGDWISLPMEPQILKEKYNELVEKHGELIIADFKKTGYAKLIDVNEYGDIFSINDILVRINSFNEDEARLFATAYVYGDGDEEYVDKLLSSKKYQYFDHVENLETLGQRVVEAGLVGYIPQRLIDLGYIDFEQIGRDFECNGVRIYGGELNTAFSEISEMEFKKRVKKGLIK